MKRRILEHFGIRKKGFYGGGPFAAMLTDVKNAVRDRAMLAIAGPVGSGKTTLFNEAVRELELTPDRAPEFIYVRNFYKEKLTIGGILTAIIIDISNESPRRDLEARSRQVIRLAGRAVAQQNARSLCVVIEEAHRVHSNTLRAIKELREASFAGISPLFSVILIGHPQLVSKLQERKEVFWRTQLMELTENNGWMVYDERLRYLRAVYGEALDSTARQRVALIKRTPLEMDYFIETKMQEAYLAGKSKLDGEVVEAGLMEMKESLDVSLGDIAKEAGMGKTTVHEVLRGINQKTEKKDAVKRALEKLAQRKARQEHIAQSA